MLYSSQLQQMPMFRSIGRINIKLSNPLCLQTPLPSIREMFARFSRSVSVFHAKDESSIKDERNQNSLDIQK